MSQSFLIRLFFFILSLASVSLGTVLFLNHFHTLPFSLRFYDAYDSGMEAAIYGLTDSYKYQFAIESAQVGNSLYLGYWHQSLPVLIVENLLLSFPYATLLLKGFIVSILLYKVYRSITCTLHRFFFLYIYILLLYLASAPSKDFWTFLILVYLFESIARSSQWGLSISFVSLLYIRPNVFVAVVLALLFSYLISWISSGRLMRVRVSPVNLVFVLLFVGFAISVFSSNLIYGFNKVLDEGRSSNIDLPRLTLDVVYTFVAPIPSIPYELYNFLLLQSGLFSYQVFGFIVFLFSAILPFCLWVQLQYFFGYDSKRLFFGLDSRCTYKFYAFFIIILLLFVGSTGYVLRSTQIIISASMIICMAERCKRFAASTI